MGEITVNVPDEFEARLEAGVLSWRDTVSDDFLVPMESAWNLDLSGVDLDAEVLCVVDGIEITRNDLRARLVLEHGKAVVNARMFTQVGRMAAAETGIPYGLTDEEWEGYFTQWLTDRGLDREMALAILSIRMQVPVEAVEPLRRDMVEAVLACFPAVESIDELPLGLGEVFASQDEMVQAASLGSLMQQTIKSHGKPSTTEQGYGTPIAGLLEPMSVLFIQMGNEARFRRGWTTLDSELPDGVLAAFFTGDPDPDAVLPPWEQTGDRELIMIDDVWSLVGPNMSEALVRSKLREVVWGKVLRSKLTQVGTLPTPGAAWRSFAEDYLAHLGTFIKLDLKIQSNGFPGRSFYIEDQSIVSGILGSLPEGWNSEDNLRDFFEANRFFVQGWEPAFEVALFQPRDPRSGADVDPDWDAALADAQAFCERVAAGEDFSTLRTAQNKSIMDAYREVNEELADSFAAEFGSGEFQQTMQMSNQVLRQSIYRDHVDGVSPLRNAIIRLDTNEVGEPWRTPIGYIVVRMHDAKLSRLEKEFEDVIDLTRFEYEQYQVRKWVTEQLSGAEVVIPGS